MTALPSIATRMGLNKLRGLCFYAVVGLQSRRCDPLEINELYDGNSKPTYVYLVRGPLTWRGPGRLHCSPCPRAGPVPPFSLFSLWGAAVTVTSSLPLSFLLYLSVAAVRAIIITFEDASSAGPSSQNPLHAAVFRSLRMITVQNFRG